ncbi:DUF2987 domain-containing protein [Alteromonadaceae bacterium BrNp21-10]|nr:DUF2987 domain-containing protein [Alteromonadaceae bacterium BrNp21-10]
MAYFARGFLLLIAVFMLLIAHGDELRVDYTAFYNHLKKIDREDTNNLEFGFGFIHVTTKNLCQINSGFIHTQKIDLPITIASDNRFSLPSEKALKLARAEVVLMLEQAVNQCDMSVQIHTNQSSLKTDYTPKELQDLNQQFEAFFDSMGSFLSFMMPSAKGLVLHMPKVTSQLQAFANDNASVELNDRLLSIPAKWLQERSTVITLGQAPEKITAWIK